jgi:hypothetical protein
MRNMRPLFVSSLLLSGLTLAGCQTTSSQIQADPCAAANARITLGNLARNSAGDAYGKCLNELRTELASARFRARELEIQATDLEAQSASLNGERKQAALRLAKVKKQQAALASRLAALKDAKQIDEQKAQKLIAQEERLSGKISGNNQGMSAGEEKSVSLEMLQLEAELAASGV